MRAGVGRASLIAGLILATGRGPGPASRAAISSDCVKVPVHIVLHFDAKRMWGTDLERNLNVVVMPRSDSRWRFDPGPPARLVDDVAQVVAHDGDIFNAACIDPATPAYVLGPEDLPNQMPGA